MVICWGFTQGRALGVPKFLPVFLCDRPIERLIDLLTDAAAILNLLDLRSIMGCPGGTR